MPIVTGTEDEQGRIGRRRGPAGARALRDEDLQRGGFVRNTKHQRRKGTPTPEELEQALAAYSLVQQKAGIKEVDTPPRGRGAQAAAKAQQAAGSDRRDRQTATHAAAAAFPPAVSHQSVTSKDQAMNTATNNTATSTVAQAAAPKTAEALAHTAALAAASAAPGAAAAAVAATPVTPAAPATKTPEQVTLEMIASATAASAAGSTLTRDNLAASTARIEAEMMTSIAEQEKSNPVPTGAAFAGIFEQALTQGQAAAAAADLVNEVVTLVTATAANNLARSMAPVVAGQRALATEVITISGKQAATETLLNGAIARVEALEKAQGVGVGAAAKAEESTLDQGLGYVQKIGSYAGFALGMVTIFKAAQTFMNRE